MRYKIVPVTPFEQNCTIFWCEKTKQAAVIDPGGDLDRVRQALEAEGLTLACILVTHGHIDHAGAVATLAGQTGVPVEGPHEDDRFWIDGMAQQGKMFGFANGQSFTPTRWLKGGDKVRFGEVELDVLHCPGHTPGHVVFFHPPSQLAQVGDVLFQGSIGRTDFPKGDHETLIGSIKEQLFPLGDAVAFIPGHGPMSTFGEERKYNPFLSGRFG
ncbi:MBL fold metallo-hydrolase [Dechloromonas sp. A34]|uniref:MBL fold metallo-hydrolase n=1 Tax=Dechloromonas sp. A34 TaxID=447588 RepID=UPI0022493F3C|nr:MBL fold metallo-hydrolase [Dechloromonas sp. A34]